MSRLCTAIVMILGVVVATPVSASAFLVDRDNGLVGMLVEPVGGHLFS